MNKQYKQFINLYLTGQIDIGEVLQIKNVCVWPSNYKKKQIFFKCIVSFSYEFSFNKKHRRNHVYCDEIIWLPEWFINKLEIDFYKK